jgi:RNA polymerase sigma-70 factor (ECF subfamily)
MTPAETPAAGVSYRATDDPALLPAVAASTEGAMNALWQRYAPAICRLAKNLAPASGRDADDIVQDTMAKVWRNAASFDPDQGRESTFVFTVARRVIIDRWRRAGRRVVEAELAADPGPAASAGNEFEAVLAREVVQDAVRRLSSRQREVIELAYFRGLTQAEIAARIGAPLGTVKTRTFSALRALRDEFGDAALVA